MLRFWLHAVLTPLIVVAAASIAVKSGVHIGRRARALAALTTAVLILAGCVEMLTASPLAPRAAGDVLRYTHAAAAPLVPPPSIRTVLAVIGAGVLIWRRSQSSWLLIGGVAMLFAAGIRTPMMGCGFIILAARAWGCRINFLGWCCIALAWIAVPNVQGWYLIASSAHNESVPRPRAARASRTRFDDARTARDDNSRNLPTWISSSIGTDRLPAVDRAERQHSRPGSVRRSRRPADD